MKTTNIMKRIVVLILGVLATSAFMNASAQKLYVWGPEASKPVQRPVFEATDTVDLVIFDGRNIPEKSKVEFTSDELVEYIINDLKYAYEGATFNVLPKAKYYKTPEDGHVTIKVGIAAYHAGFGADIDIAIGSVGGSFAIGGAPKGKWNGLTAFYVRVFDKRNGADVEKEGSVSSLVDKPNMTGYTTAKKCLKESYADAFNKLCFVIDSVFLQ